MTTKTISVITPRLPAPAPPPLWPVGPCSTEEQLVRIKTLGQRIDRYIDFMSQAGNSNGVSADTKTRAVDAFYGQMVALERQLGRMYEAFRLE
jgi:hypothetical protein